MIQEVTMYSVKCDICGTSAEEGCDYSCWESPESAREQADYGDWKEIDDKDYCPQHWQYDEESDEPTAVGQEAWNNYPEGESK